MPGGGAGPAELSAVRKSPVAVWSSVSLASTREAKVEMSANILVSLCLSVLMFADILVSLCLTVLIYSWIIVVIFSTEALCVHRSLHPSA